jgi:hypothetical protein
MVAPATKFVPVRVTGTLCPWTPLLGVIDPIVGGAGFVGGAGLIVNARVPLLTSPGFMTVTL